MVGVVGGGKRDGGGGIPVYTSRSTLLVHVSVQAPELRPWRSRAGCEPRLVHLPEYDGRAELGSHSIVRHMTSFCKV